MNTDLSFVWLSLLLLGVFHGINPGMGWLFAVALGLQEQRRKAVWRALLPLALGHALAIGCAILLAGIIGFIIPLHYLKWFVAAVLFGLGLFHLLRHRHPRYGGMRVSLKDLTVWSFLMASAHGAGLMVLPFLFGNTNSIATDGHEAAGMHTMPMEMPMSEGVAMTSTPVDAGAHAGHMTSLLASLPVEPAVGLVATLVHTVGYLLIIALVAVLVYEKLGLRLLRSAWVNLDLIWAGTLMATAVLALFI